MNQNQFRTVGSWVIALLLALTLGQVGFAQGSGWEKVKRDGESPPAATTQQPVTQSSPDSPGSWGSEDLGRMLNVQVGYPLVFAPRYFFPVFEDSQVGVGPILLPGLFGITGEYRRYLISPRIQKFSWYLNGGLTLYSIRSKDRVSSPVGFNVGTGTLYRTTSAFALGGEIGYMGLSGGTKSDPIKSYGLEAGKSTVYVNFQVSYLF